MGIELKCRRNNETKKAFQVRVLQDIEKMNSGIIEDYRLCWMYSIALINSLGDLDEWDDAQKDKFGNVKYALRPEVYLPAGLWAVPIWIGAFQ